MLLLAIVPAWPYFRAGVPRTNDLLPHLHRAYALDRMVRLGYLWPRWSVDLAHGYGYPVFNFFPALSHWVTVGWHRLGLPMLTAYRVAVYSHFAITAFGSYALGKALTGRPAGGWSLAVVYTLSPYLLYDAIVRGSPPESQALALMPLVMLGVWKLLNRREPMDEGRPLTSASRSRASPLKILFAESRNTTTWLVVTAITYAAMILSHHPVALQFSLGLAVWLAARLAWPPSGKNGPPRPWRQVWRVVVALGLGGALSAFFSLPALFEIDATRANLSISQGYSYTDNYLPLSELFRWPILPADPFRINPPVVRPLPLAGLVLAAITIPLAWRRFEPDGRRAVLQFTLLAVLATWLVTPASGPLWETLPLLRFTLYPWRFLGLAGLGVAILVALGVGALGGGAGNFRAGGANQPAPTSKRKMPVPSSGTLLVVTLLVTIESIPWLFPPREPVAEVVTATDVAEAEQPPFLMGTTTLGEFLPIGVGELPDTGELKAFIAAGENPDRLLVPEEVTRVRQSEDPLDERYLIATGRPVTLVYRQFYFPGWRATVDGQEIPLAPSVPHGLIAIELPAGTHDLRLRFGATPIRDLGQAISLAALAILAVLVISAVRRPPTTRQPIGRSIPAAPASADRHLTLLFLSLFALLLLAFFTVVDTPLRRPTLRPGGLLGLPQIEPLDFAGELRLLTFEQSAAEIASDEPIRLTTYWQPQREIGVDYLFGIQVVDERGVTWHRDVARPADWRFVAGGEIWPRDQYRLEPFVVTLLAGAPPGDYRFLVGLVRRDTGQTVAAHLVGGFEVISPALGGMPLEPGMRPVDLVAGGLSLAGTRQDRDQAHPGDPVRVTTLWDVKGGRAPAGEYTLFLVDSQGETALEKEGSIGGTWAPDAWRPGDRFRSESLLRLPAGLPSGRYRWEVRLAGQTAELGHLLVEALERTFELPAPPISVEETLGGLATLLGAELQPCPEAPSLPCTVSLFWRAEATFDTSYKVFVHLVGEDGQIAAQSDGEPAAWDRPTMGWLSPEIVRDDHLLPLPENLATGIYTLQVGMYDPESGSRLLTADGQDTLAVTIIRLR